MRRVADTAVKVGPALLPYRRQWLRADLLAGLAAGAVVIPQAMAYATVADMPVQYGLYTCMVPLVVYAFLGGSRTVSVTTTSTVATLTASTLLGAGIVAGSPDALSSLITLTLLVGIILLAARLLRLGSVVENINQATLVGLKAGVGLSVAASQLSKLLGVQSDNQKQGFFRVLWSALRQVGQANIATVALSVASIVVLLVMAKYLPRIPGPLVAAGLGIGLAASGFLQQHEVTLIPPVPQGLPVPSLPPLDHVASLIPGALAIAMMSFLETVSAARAVRRQDEPYVDPDRELCANGVAAVIGSFLHTLPPSGGFSQSSVNVRSGARSQVSGLVTAALAVVVACFLAPVLGYLPEATIGAMVLVSVIGLVDVRALVRLYRFNMMEFSLALLTTALALSVGLLPAVAAGVLLTLYFVLREANSAHVVQLVRRPDGSWTERAVTAAAVPADPLVLRFQIGLYTANLRSNSQAVRQRALGADPRPHSVVLDLSQLPWVTSTILDGLRDLETELSGNGVSVTYAALRDSVRPTAQRWPWWHQVESEGRYAESADAAIARGPGHDGA